MTKTLRIYKADHWIYKYIPRDYSEIDVWWKWLPWLFLTKEGDGFFGEYSTNWPDWQATKNENGERAFVPTLWIALKWRLRNPSCNLINYALAWRGLWFSDGVYSYGVLQWAEGENCLRLYYRKPIGTWDQAGKQFSLALLPLNIHLRTKWFEFYLGWAKSTTYKAGAALRLANSRAA